MTDPAGLAALHARCFRHPRPWHEHEFRALLDLPGSLLLQEPNAFLLGRVIADEAELLTLAVAPEARRRGSGRRLVAAFLAAARAGGARRAFLEVAADNAAAQALYAATGWQAAGRRRGYYTAPGQPPTDALVLAHRLDPGPQSTKPSPESC